MRIGKWDSKKCVPLEISAHVFCWLINGLSTVPFWLAILSLSTKKNAVIAIMGHTAK